MKIENHAKVTNSDLMGNDVPVVQSVTSNGLSFPQSKNTEKTADLFQRSFFGAFLQRRFHCLEGTRWTHSQTSHAKHYESKKKAGFNKRKLNPKTPKTLLQ